MENVQSREPWNKGKLVGQKPPLKLKDIWGIRIHFSSAAAFETLLCSILPSTANYAAAIWLTFGFETWFTVIRYRQGQLSYKEDSATGAVRADGTDPKRRGRVDSQSQSQIRAAPIPEPATKFSSYFNPAVCPDRGSLGQFDWPRPRSLWHAHNASNQGHPDL